MGHPTDLGLISPASQGVDKRENKQTARVPTMMVMTMMMMTMVMTMMMMTMVMTMVVTTVITIVITNDHGNATDEVHVIIHNCQK